MPVHTHTLTHPNTHTGAATIIASRFVAFHSAQRLCPITFYALSRSAIDDTPQQRNFTAVCLRCTHILHYPCECRVCAHLCRAHDWAFDIAFCIRIDAHIGVPQFGRFFYISVCAHGFSKCCQHLDFEFGSTVVSMHFHAQTRTATANRRVAKCTAQMYFGVSRVKCHVQWRMADCASVFARRQLPAKLQSHVCVCVCTFASKWTIHNGRQEKWRTKWKGTQNNFMRKQQKKSGSQSLNQQPVHTRANFKCRKFSFEIDESICASTLTPLSIYGTIFAFFRHLIRYSLIECSFGICQN